jgi:hypothetical protein
MPHESLNYLNRVKPQMRGSLAGDASGASKDDTSEVWHKR